jgi:hypothetical protein
MIGDGRLCDEHVGEAEHGRPLADETGEGQVLVMAVVLVDLKRKFEASLVLKSKSGIFNYLLNKISFKKITDLIIKMLTQFC